MYELVSVRSNLEKNHIFNCPNGYTICVFSGIITNMLEFDWALIANSEEVRSGKIYRIEKKRTKNVSSNQSDAI